MLGLETVLRFYGLKEERFYRTEILDDFHRRFFWDTSFQIFPRTRD